MTTHVPTKCPILCHPWRCRLDSAYIQSSCKSSSHIDGSDSTSGLPSCVWTFSSVQRMPWWFSTQWKCLWKLTEKLSVPPWTTGSWQVDKHVLFKSYLAKVLRKTREKHCISQIFHSFCTTPRRSAFTPTKCSANTEEFFQILRKSKLFARFLQGLCKVF